MDASQPAPASPSENQKPLVLITGANGAIGSALAGSLADDFRVVGLDVSCEGAQVPCLEFDITEDDSVTSVLREVQAQHGSHIATVIHLAGYYDFSGEQSPLYDAINVEGTRRLLRALRDSDLHVERFVYASTMLVHAPTAPGEPITEDWPLEAKWIYPQSKLATERVVESEHGDIPYVLLRIAGMYTDQCGAPLLAHQIQRIYERELTSHFFAGNPHHGQAFIHIDDLVKVFDRLVRRRENLPAECPLLVGEPEVLSYDALQDRLGELIHGQEWETLRMPKSAARMGAQAQSGLEEVVPDSLDKGEKPFIKPFMVKIADDHYEIDIKQAEELLDWQPRHSLADTLPTMVEVLKNDPVAFYEANKLTTPVWLDDLADSGENPQRLREQHEALYRSQHQQSLWAHWFNLFFGLWLLTSPPILGYDSVWMTWNDIICGALVIMFSALSLSWRMGWARWANTAVGVWLLFAPLIFLAPTAAGYMNDTLIGGLIIACAILVRPAPGMSIMARMTGPDVPDGWDYSPSTWDQRLPIIILACVGFFISRHLTAYQLEHIPSAFDPFFSGAPGDGKNGTEEITTSWVSESFPISDAGVGAITYLLEILTGVLGSRARWRTMPWLVIFFGFMIIPLGGISITFIIIQPVLLGTWCFLCLIQAAAMLWQIPYSFDELLATFQFLKRRKRAGKPLLKVIFMGDTDEGGKLSEKTDFERPPQELARDMVMGGMGYPWSLVTCGAIGVALMCTRLLFDHSGAMANSDHIVGCLVLTIVISALAEVGRPLRFLNIPLGLWLLISPWLLSGTTEIGVWASVIMGGLLVILSFPRGPVKETYGGFERFIV